MSQNICKYNSSYSLLHVITIGSRFICGSHVITSPNNRPHKLCTVRSTSLAASNFIYLSSDHMESKCLIKYTCTIAIRYFDYPSRIKYDQMSHQTRYNYNLCRQRSAISVLARHSYRIYKSRGLFIHLLVLNW